VGSSLFECTLPLAGGGCADQFVKLYSRQATACSAARLFRMNVPPLVSNAQMILAILLAKAMAATLAGLRANNAVSQGDIVAPRRACRNTAVAPTTRRERSAGLPIFEIFPKRSLPPLECIFGVSPIHAAKCRPEVKAPGSGTTPES